MHAQRVYIVDDDEAVLDAIKELVESVGLEAETFPDARAFLNADKSDRAGCLVLDIRMARMSGLALQQRLKELNEELPIIFVTGHGDVETAVTAMKAGAVDFVQKPYHEQSLIDSINKALEIDAQNRPAAENRRETLSRLTDRERQIMQFLLKGLRTKSIARELEISPRTVDVHRQRILHKCGANTVAELIRRFGSEE